MTSIIYLENNSSLIKPLLPRNKSQHTLEVKYNYFSLTLGPCPLSQMTDIRVVIGKINVHGCLTVMQRRLETHVTIILIVFGVRDTTQTASSTKLDSASGPYRLFLNAEVFSKMSLRWWCLFIVFWKTFFFNVVHILNFIIRFWIKLAQNHYF